MDILVNNAGTSPYYGPMVDLDASRAAKRRTDRRRHQPVDAAHAEKVHRSGAEALAPAQPYGRTTEQGERHIAADPRAQVYRRRREETPQAPAAIPKSRSKALARFGRTVGREEKIMAMRFGPCDGAPRRYATGGASTVVSVCLR
ncbi:hypothetical protein OG417_11495 [Actinoallomurus sp. NBC_01490]|uniref:hypothetical protein n=1 Tax=Actinoallomurus sp. NBC_01490 TaxID=2903557 RepID=UPI002E36BF80|nr:hypothetical protein [Actinoallomurus sp. NBC_01490]